MSDQGRLRGLFCYGGSNEELCHRIGRDRGWTGRGASSSRDALCEGLHQERDYLEYGLQLAVWHRGLAEGHSERGPGANLHAQARKGESEHLAATLCYI